MVLCFGVITQLGGVIWSAKYLKTCGWFSYLEITPEITGLFTIVNVWPHPFCVRNYSLACMITHGWLNHKFGHLVILALMLKWYNLSTKQTWYLWHISCMCGLVVHCVCTWSWVDTINRHAKKMAVIWACSQSQALKASSTSAQLEASWQIAIFKLMNCHVDALSIYTYVTN